MGTLDILGLDICKENDILKQEISKLNVIPVQEEVLQIHGFMPPKKAEGNVCLVYENVNGLKTPLPNNKKVESMKEIHEAQDWHCGLLQAQNKFQAQEKCQWLQPAIQGGRRPNQSIAAHKVHENIGRIQQGGTSLLLFGHLTQQLDPNESGKDPTV